MKHTYLSTFISGFDEIVEKQLLIVLSDAKISELHDGLIVFETENHDTVSQLRFINNSFVILSSCDTKDTDKPETIVKKFISEAKNTQLPEFIRKHETFKVFVSRENQTVSIARDVRTEAVNYLIRRTKLRLEPLVSDLEFWFIIRREGRAYFAVRIPGERKKLREKGELANELSHLLCLISEPDSKDVILDPFAGSGSILRERVTAFPFKHGIASDKETFKQLKKQFGNNKRVSVQSYDALHLENLQPNSLNKIITDPPWGMYKEDKRNYVKFYIQMLREFERVLAKDGIAVILTARKEELAEALKSMPNFSLRKEYHILVSGKKAGVYKLQIE